jgi:hypothetical protein
MMLNSGLKSFLSSRLAGSMQLARAWQEEFVAKTNSREFVENVSFSMVK